MNLPTLSAIGTANPLSFLRGVRMELARSWYNDIIMSMPVQISLSVTIFREGKAFIAYSPALDLTTSASSFKEVQRRFSEVVQIFFEEVTQKGTLDDVLPSFSTAPG